MRTNFSKKGILVRPVSLVVLISFILTGFPLRSYAVGASTDNLRKAAVKNYDGGAELKGILKFYNENKERISGLSGYLARIGLSDVDAIVREIVTQFPLATAAEELSFLVCNDGLWVAGPEQEEEPQIFLRMNAAGKNILSEKIKAISKEAKADLIEKWDITKISVPASQPHARRQILLETTAELFTERKVIAGGLTYEQPAYVVTPLMERMIFGAKLEKEFREGFAKQEKKAIEEYPELAALIDHMKNPESGPYEFTITPELAQKWNLKNGLAKELKKMAPIATAGMRNSQNPLFPGDLSLPMNILLNLLLTNELAEMAVQTSKAEGTNSPEAIVGGEVRYNTPLENEMLRRRFAELGIIVHSPPRGVYLPIGATSYITTVLDIMFTIYDTASHSPRGTKAKKLMGNLKTPVSPFMETHLKELDIDLEKYKKSRSEGAQLLIEDMMALAEGVEKKIGRIYQGDKLVIKFAGGADKNIRFDIENPSVSGNINVIDRYAEYLKKAYVTEKNIKIVKQALNNGLKMGFDQARGASNKFFQGVYKGVFGEEAVRKINWTGTTPDSFYGDTGMTDFNQKQLPDEFVKRYVEAVSQELDAFFSSASFGATFLMKISEKDLCRVIKEDPRKEKEEDSITIRFKIFAKEEEGMLKRLGMPYIILANGKILGFYRPKISDISEDVSLLEVVAASKLPAFMLAKPIGYVYPTTDPDGDRFVMMQVEKNDPATKARLEQRNIGYLVLSDEKLLVVYVPNQNFLQTQNAYIDQLKSENKFSQNIDDLDAVTFFAIKTTVSSETWSVLYASEGIPVVQIPVGFKEIGAIMRKVEFQIKLNEFRKKLGLKPRMVIVHDIFGQAIKLGYNPRLLFAGEESGGMVQGSLELLSTEDGLRSYLSWREKNAVEASVCNTIMICKQFNQAMESALFRGVKKDNVYNDEQFLEDISLSKMLGELYEQKEMKQTAELRFDKVLVDPLTSSQASKDVRDKMDKEGYYRRDVNSGFFLSLAFGLQDGFITLNDVKAILKEVLLADTEMVNKIISVTDNTAPEILLKQIDDLQRCLFVGDAVYLGFSNGAWEIVRPSGTDTKIKSYPSSADAIVSAVMANAIGEAYPQIFFELAKGKEALDMPATTAFVRSLLQNNPLLIDIDAIQKRQMEQYQRGLKVDTMPDWFIDPVIYNLLVERFPEYTKDGQKDSSVHVVLGPVSQKEALRYDPESHIIYTSWGFDDQMQEAGNKAELFQEALNFDGGGKANAQLIQTAKQLGVDAANLISVSEAQNVIHREAGGNIYDAYTDNMKLLLELQKIDSRELKWSVSAQSSSDEPNKINIVLETSDSQGKEVIKTTIHRFESNNRDKDLDLFNQSILSVFTKPNFSNAKEVEKVKSTLRVFGSMGIVNSSQLREATVILVKLISLLNPEFEELNLKNPRILMIDTQFFLKTGALIGAQKFAKLLGNQFKIGLYGAGAEKLKILLGENENIMAAGTEDELIKNFRTENKNAEIELVYLRPAAESGLTEGRELIFSKDGLAIVDLAKAVEVMFPSLLGKAAFENFFKELNENKVIAEQSYNAPVRKFESLDTDTKALEYIELPAIMPTDAVASKIAEDVKKVSGFITETFI